jgi:hypothetical protein
LEDALLERFEVGLADLEVYHGELELVLLVAESLFLENLCYQVYDLVGRALIIISLLFHIAAKVLPSLHFDTLEVWKFGNKALDSHSEATHLDLANDVVPNEATLQLGYIG